MLTLGACALRSSDRHVASARSEPPQTMCGLVDTTVNEVVETPSFALMATSEPLKEEAVRSLRRTVSTFRWMFGECPARIGVVVVDTSAKQPSRRIPIPPGDGTTIVVVGGGQQGKTPTRASASLSKELRIIAASAWLTDYTKLWSTSFDQQGLVFANENGDILERAEFLPDWLRAGVLRVLAEGETSNTRAELTNDEMVPLNELFAYRLNTWQVALVEQQLRGAATVDGSTSKATSVESGEERHLRAFVLQSASVMRYLRETQGDEEMAMIIGASVAGYDFAEILTTLPKPMTTEQLEVAWRTSMNHREEVTITAHAGGSR
jgi:hypothetical protein